MRTSTNSLTAAAKQKKLLLHTDQGPVPMTQSDCFPGDYNMTTWSLNLCAESVREKLQSRNFCSFTPVTEAEIVHKIVCSY